MLEEADAETVILATGAESIVLGIEGLDQPMVCEATQILSGRVPPGENVVVVGGGLIGMETADFLTGRAGNVTIVEVLERSPVSKRTAHGYQLHERLSRAGCTLLFNTQVERVTEGSVIAMTGDERTTLAPVDQVVSAVGMKPR